MNPEKPYDKHQDKITKENIEKSSQNNNDPAKTHVVFNEIGSN